MISDKDSASREKNKGLVFLFFRSIAYLRFSRKDSASREKYKTNDKIDPIYLLITSINLVMTILYFVLKMMYLCNLDFANTT